MEPNDSTCVPREVFTAPAPGISRVPTLAARMVSVSSALDRNWRIKTHTERMELAKAFVALAPRELATIHERDPDKYALLKKAYEWSLDAIPPDCKWGELTPRQQARLAALDVHRFHRLRREHQESR